MKFAAIALAASILAGCASTQTLPAVKAPGEVHFVMVRTNPPDSKAILTVNGFDGPPTQWTLPADVRQLDARAWDSKGNQWRATWTKVP